MNTSAVPSSVFSAAMPSGFAQIQRQRPLVAPIDLPEQRVPLVLPLPQRIALRRLDLDDVGAEIAKLQAEHIAGDEPRQVHDADAAQRTLG